MSNFHEVPAAYRRYVESVIERAVADIRRDMACRTDEHRNHALDPVSAVLIDEVPGTITIYIVGEITSTLGELPAFGSMKANVDLRGS